MVRLYADYSIVWKSWPGVPTREPALTNERLQHRSIRARQERKGGLHNARLQVRVIRPGAIVIEGICFQKQTLSEINIIQSGHESATPFAFFAYYIMCPAHVSAL